MAVIFNKKELTNQKAVFWRKGDSFPGGFKLLQNFPIGTLIPRGTLCQINYPALTAAILKVAKVVAGGTTTAPRVVKGTLFQTGDLIAKVGANAGKTVSNVDRSNPDYDVITFNSALTGLAAGDVLVETSDVGTGAQAYSSNAVVESTKKIERAADETISACDNVRVLEGCVYPIPSTEKIGFCLKGNPTISFIYQ